MLRALISFVVHRRLLALCATLLVAIYGVYSYTQTAIEAYPDVTNVQVGVIAQAPGLAPEEVERQITQPLERELNGTPGLMSLRSESYFGLSMINLVFDDNAQSFTARAEVAQRLPQANLPDGVTPEMAPDYTPLGKVYYYQLQSDRHTLAQLRTEQEWHVTRVLKQVQGVADVVSIGGFAVEYHVEVDPQKAQALGVTLEDVADALTKSNRNVGGGLMQRGEQSLIVRGIGLLGKSDDINAVVVTMRGSQAITVGDVARVLQAYTPRQGSVGKDTHDDVVQGIVLLKRGANPSAVLEQVHAKVDQLNNGELPKGMRMVQVYDRSELVNHTLGTVQHNLLFGAVLIVGILWLVLRSLRGSLIVATVIPLSLLVAFIGLHLLGMPANLISMGAIDFGIMVDGAVVLAENIIRNARLKHPKTPADMRHIIIDSAVAVARPTLFAMAIVIAALIPVFTLQSIEGRIFRPLAMTYTFALLGALVFAMALVPALCALFLKPKHVMVDEPKLFEHMHSGYERFMSRVIGQRGRQWAVVGAALVVLVLVGFSARWLGTEFLPELDEGDAYVLVQMPASISLEKGQEVLHQVRERLGRYPEVITVVSEQGRPESGTDNETLNLAKVLVRLKPHDQWTQGLTKAALIEQMRASLSEIPGVAFNFAQPIRDSVEESTSGARGQVVLKIYGPDIPKLRELLKQTVELVKPIDGVVDLDLYRDAPAPQVHVNFNRSALASHGISMDTAQRTLAMATAGNIVTTLWEGEHPIPIRIRLPLADRMDEARIGDIAIAQPNGNTVPLRSLAHVGVEIGNSSIFREGNARYMALKFNVEGRDIGSVVKDTLAVFNDKVKLPEGYTAVWGGEWENQQRAAARLRLVVPLSLLVVYALLFSALGRARSAGVILMCAPFAMVGGVLALHFTGIELSISAAIGFIALLGQVALAGLLVVSAIEERRLAGADLLTATVQGTAERMRSVILVALLALLGLLPMAMSTGVGSETQRPFASVIVGGMLTMPAIALLLLPVLYAWLGPKTMATQEEEDEA